MSEMHSEPPMSLTVLLSPTYPVPLIGPSSGSVLSIPFRGKACLALGSPTLLPLPTLDGAGRIALMGLAAASNEGLPRILPLSSGALGPGVSRSTLKNTKRKIRNMNQR